MNTHQHAGDGSAALRMPALEGRCSRTAERRAGSTWCFPIEQGTDLVAARLQGRQLARDLGFSSMDATIVGTVVSELARSILEAAGRGELYVEALDRGDRSGIEIVARHRGDDTQQVEQALQYGVETLERLGVGLAGVCRLMDEFHLLLEQGKGTTVALLKWKS